MKLNKDIEKSFPRIEKLLTKTMLLEFANTPKDDLEKYNFGLGTMIRLKILRPKSTLYENFTKHGFTDKNEMAMEMIKKFHEYLLHKI